MCKKVTVAYGDFIGQRMVGWCVFNGKDFNFLSDKQVGNQMKQGGLVNGLRLSSEGQVEIDDTFTSNLMGKSGLTFSPISAAGADDSEVTVNKYYALIKVIKNKSNTTYQFITSRCGCESFVEQQLKIMLAMVPMGGVRLDEKGKVVVHPSVEVLEVGELKTE